MQMRGTAPEFHDTTHRGSTRMKGMTGMKGAACAPKGSKALHTGRTGRLSGNHKTSRGSK